MKIFPNIEYPLLMEAIAHRCCARRVLAISGQIQEGGDCLQ
jgi:hypothetical protein